VLINSHQLAEVERVCHRVVFVKQGASRPWRRCAPARPMRACSAFAFSTEGAQPSSGQIGQIAAQAGATFRAGRRPMRASPSPTMRRDALIAALVNGGLAVIEAGAEEAGSSGSSPSPRPERRREGTLVFAFLRQRFSSPMRSGSSCS